MYRPNMSSSFPKSYSYTLYEEENRSDSPPLLDGDKPRILLMGLRRSGKSSILKVVFQKMSPNETLFLESTNKIVKSDIDNSTFVQFQCWDFPGDFWVQWYFKAIPKIVNLHVLFRVTWHIVSLSLFEYEQVKSIFSIQHSIRKSYSKDVMRWFL